ncbi:hypothetical protein [Noviherbaspirillum soli]|uniref:hypothetical protein n=1 Tax=Noviherbaspirillum soli TaxID=1064518 RepID=UPI00188B2691|nr:hypothetical protein [Noviherbaspirillum soli]
MFELFILPENFWPDLTKTLVGSFVGASLAFSSNLWFHHKDRKRKHKAAGNLALATAIRQWNDFLVIRKGFMQTKQAITEQNASVPIYLQAKPTHYYFSENLKFDYASLAFLFEHGRAELFTTLALAEQRYYDLASVIKLYTAAAETMQSRLASTDFSSDKEYNLSDVEFAIGPDLLCKLQDTVSGLFQRFDEDESSYTSAITDLRSAMVQVFGDKGIVSTAKIG